MHVRAYKLLPHKTQINGVPKKRSPFVQSLGGIFYNFMAGITFHDLVLHSSSKEYGNEQGKRNKEGLSAQSANKFWTFLGL